jgi:hypothetical protein
MNERIIRKKDGRRKKKNTKENGGRANVWRTYPTPHTAGQIDYLST